MGKVRAATIAAALAAVPAAQAASWQPVGSSADSRPYESIAQLMKSGLRNVHGFRVAAGPAGAKVGGEVMCLAGGSVNSYTFAWTVGRTRVKVLKASGTCTVAAEATLKRGGSVTVTVWMR